MSSSTREKIIGYLAAGVSQSAAAQAAGVSDGYVSQLMELEEVRELVAAKKGDRLEKHLEIDETIETGEKLALQQIVKKLQSPLTPLREAVQAFSVLNSARKKSEAGQTGNGAGAVDTVVFVLPKAARTMIQINSDNQIIEVNGSTTAPLPSKALPSLGRELELKKRVVELTARSDQREDGYNQRPQLQPQQLQARNRELPHVQEVREKAATRDTVRAQAVLADIATVIDGVQVVI